MTLRVLIEGFCDAGRALCSRDGLDLLVCLAGCLRGALARAWGLVRGR